MSFISLFYIEYFPLYDNEDDDGEDNFKDYSEDDDEEIFSYSSTFLCKNNCTFNVVIS